MAEDGHPLAPAPDLPEPSNTKAAIGAVKTFFTSDGPVEFTKKMVMFLAVAVAIGVGLGYFYMSHQAKRHEIEVKKAQIDTLRKNANESAKNALKSQQQSAAIDAAIAKGEAQAARTRNEAAARITRQQEQARDQLTQVLPQLDEAGRAIVDQMLDGPRLDVGTVRLLNDAREGSGMEPAGRGDAAGKAPAKAARP
jgi:uncharacterized protein HemX